jgi:anti-anti-sigma factor
MVGADQQLEIRTRSRRRKRRGVAARRAGLREAPGAWAALSAALQRQASSVELDLREVTFADSSLIHLLLDSERATRAVGAQLRVVQPVGPVARLLALAGLDKRLEFVR